MKLVRKPSTKRYMDNCAWCLKEIPVAEPDAWTRQRSVWGRICTANYCSQRCEKAAHKRPATVLDQLRILLRRRLAS